MAREQINGRSALCFGYNPVTGWLIESTPENTAILREVREGFDQDEWKRGFTGNTGLTAEARKALAARGVKSEALSGEIVAAYYAEQRDEARGQTYHTLRVKLVDNNEAYLVSLGLGTGPGQMLVQKLLSVEPGERVRLTVFGTVANGYANHAVSLKDADGNEIRGPGGLFREAETLVQQKIAVLAQQGLDSREVTGQARAQVKREFHQELLEGRIQPVFDAWNEARNEARKNGTALSGGEPVAATQTGSEYGGDGGFEEMEDDVPF